MGYVKVDDGFFRNPKVLGVSRDAKLLYLAGLCYSGSSLTDGLIPKAALRSLGADADIRNPERSAAELVDGRLWYDNPKSYLIHDYLQHNTSSEEVQAKRDAARERMQRNRSQNVRANKPRSSPEVRQPETETETETETEGKKTTTRKRENGAVAPSPSIHPFALLESLCDEIGQDMSVLSEREKGKQLAAAKRLAASGVTEADVRSMTTWLRGQSWVTSGVDLTLLDKQLGKWQLAGKPSGAPRNGTTANGRASPEDRRRAAFAEARADLLGPDWDHEDVIETTGRVQP